MSSERSCTEGSGRVPGTSGAWNARPHNMGRLHGAFPCECNCERCPLGITADGFHRRTAVDKDDDDDGHDGTVRPP